MLSSARGSPQSIRFSCWNSEISTPLASTSGMKQPFDAVVGDPRVVPLAPNALHLAPGAVPIDRRDEPGADFFHDGVMLELREVRAVPGLGVARDRQVLAHEREPDGPTDVQQDAGFVVRPQTKYPAVVRWPILHTEPERRPVVLLFRVTADLAHGCGDDGCPYRVRFFAVAHSPKNSTNTCTSEKPAAVRWSLRLLAVNPVRCAWWRLPSRISRRCP